MELMWTPSAMSRSESVSSLGLEPVSNTTLSDQIADQIVDRIASQKIQAGQRLVEAAIAGELNVSRVPVREAMQALSRQGLLVNAIGRGRRVADFDADWAAQLCDVRLALERICAHLVADKLRREPSLIGKVDAVLHELREQEGQVDGQELNRIDIMFHDALYEIADSPLLSALWSGIARHVLILFSIERSQRHEFSQIVTEHERYRSVLVSGTALEIDREVQSHLMTFRILRPRPAAGPDVRTLSVL
jgi:DNA-binding GntR family transcriptional regulator